MDEHITGLIDSLERQLALYKRLLDVTLEERAALAQRDAAAVRACVDAKARLLTELRAETASAARSMQRVSSCCPGRPQAVADLSRLLTGAHERRLRAIRGELGTVREALVRENRKNGLFAANSLRHVADVMQLLSGADAAGGHKGGWLA